MGTQSVAPTPFAHIHAPRAVLYRRVMQAFASAKRSFLVHLRPEDLAEALGQTQDAGAIQTALDALVDWGNLRADPDTSRVTTVEDFYRARYLYQLTPEGEAAETALTAYDEALGRRGELQSVALEDIHLRVLNLVQQARLEDPDSAVVHSLLRELAGLLESLAANASAFMSSLQRTIELQDANEDAFLAYKDRLISYLEHFIGELQVKSAEIAHALDDLDGLGMPRVLALAAAREAADAAPGMLADNDEREAALRARREVWQARWSGLRAWFLGSRSHPSQAHLLRQRARAAIPDLLAVVVLLQERRAGRSDRSADFRALAVWFAEAPSEADAHRLWRVAFGLSSSRHLTADASALALAEAQATSTATSWLDAAPTPISPRLRATGRYQRPGAISQVVDRSAERRLLDDRLNAEHQQTLRARRRLATGRVMRLSELGALDQSEFSLFLALLGDALAAAWPGAGEIDTLTGDGSLRVQLVPTGDGRIAEIGTPDGVFRGADHRITISDVAALESDHVIGGQRT